MLVEVLIVDRNGARSAAGSTFAVAGHDLRALLRGGASDAEISAGIGGIWWMREDRYSELRTAATAGLPKVEMSYVGG